MGEKTQNGKDKKIGYRRLLRCYGVYSTNIPQKIQFLETGGNPVGDDKN